MARGRQHHEDRARRIAVALASFCRAQAGLPLEAVAESAECLSLISEVLTLADADKPAQRLRSRAGRPQVHDRQFAKAALLDYVTQDPDGMATTSRLVRELEARFDASGHRTPGETWLKAVVREFQAEAAAFELDAAAAFTASLELQTIFEDLATFLRFRRAKCRAAQLWHDNSELRAQFASPELLLEALFLKGFTPAGEPAISAHSRLAHPTDVAHPIRRERSSP